MPPHSRTHSPLLLYATIFAVALILVSLWFSWKSDTKTAENEATAIAQETTVPEEAIRPVDATDHVFGNPNAPLKLIVYADFECPYCSQYHETLKLVVEEYGKDGRVAVVYRHMPIVKLHPKSPTYALASECVAQSGGTKAFWDFADAMYATVTPETTLESADLVNIAESVGVDRDEFTLCMRTSNLMSRVEKDFDEALESGASATPYTVIVTPFQQISREGAREYPVVAATIQAMLRNMGDHASVETDERMPNLFEN